MASNENKTISDEDKIRAACMLTEHVIQRYMAYLDGSEVSEIFPTEASENTVLEFKKTDGEIFKLKLDIVAANYIFPIEKCNADVVRQGMISLIECAKVVYQLLKSKVQNTKLDIFDKESIMQYIPQGTFVINSSRYGEMISKKDKRIGFIWA